jgi:hypothetical protein
MARTKHLVSFMSEHTAEYALTPDLIRRLSPHFNGTIPMFFWSTREGNAAARKGMSNVAVRLLTAFPRRPKTTGSDQSHVFMKVNVELLSYAQTSARFGVSVCAGVPLITSLSTFRANSPCCWFDLQGFGESHQDHILEIANDGTAATISESNSSSPQPLNDMQLAALTSRCPLLSWVEAVEKLREIRSLTPDSGRFSLFGGYKPFHLVFTF